MTDHTIRRMILALAFVVVGFATLSSTGCVAPEAMAGLQEVAAADEGDMADESLPVAARRIARSNAYAIHQALYLLDADYRRPAWVVSLEAERAGAE